MDDQFPDGGGLPERPPGDARPDEARFVPDRRFTALAAGGALLAALVAALSTDPVGRLLAGLAAVLLAGYAASDLLFSPRLTASPGGVTVRGPFLRARLPWTEIEHVRADTRLRHGLRSTTLEIDAGAVLVVLSRRALGADPETAAAAVNRLRPR